jgi:protein ImuA
MSRAARLAAVRAKVAALEAGGAPAQAVFPFGDVRLDQVFPAAGLPLGCWHEVAGEGLEIETAAAPGAFVAALAKPLARRGTVVWVMRRGDLYAPGLAGMGFPADRLIQVQARDEAQALGALEDALGSAGVTAAIGEVGSVDLTAGRRLQLACERRGATGFVIRRRPFGGSAEGARGLSPAAGGVRGAAAGSAAATRWTVAAAPSGAPNELLPGVQKAPRDPKGLVRTVGEEGGLGPPRWRVALTRCRGGRPGCWILEMSDGAYPLRVVAALGDGQLEAAQPLRLAG